MWIVVGLLVGQAPPPKCGRVAERGALARVKQRRHQLSFDSEPVVSERVDARMDLDQAPLRDPPGDYVLGESASEQLRPADHPELARRGFADANFCNRGPSQEMHS